MKKFQKLLLSLMTVFLLIGGYSFKVLAADGTLLFKAEGPEKAKPGDTVTVNIVVDEAGITDGKGEVIYDSKGLEYVEGKLAYATEGDLIEFVVNPSEEGRLVIAWATVSSMKEPGTVMTLSFKVKEDATEGSKLQVSPDIEYVYGEDGSLSKSEEEEGATITVVKDSTNPTDPTDPTDPSDPTDPTDPSKPSDPSKPTDPTTPEKPDDSAKTGDNTPILLLAVACTGSAAIIAFCFYKKYRLKGGRQ